MRTRRRAPSAISSSTTIAALGPPMPVDWIVSGRPSRGQARVAPQAAVVVEHPRAVEQLLGHGERAVGIAGQQHPLRQLGGRAQVVGADLVPEGQAAEI